VVAAGLTLPLPVVAFVPLQPPEARQLVALVLDQLRVLEAPLATVVGLAVKVRVGAGLGAPVTVSTAPLEAVVPTLFRTRQRKTAPLSALVVAGVV
jgi:hypothetical protein